MSGYRGIIAGKCDSVYHSHTVSYSVWNGSYVLGFGMGNMDIIEHIYLCIYIIHSMVHKFESIIVFVLGSAFADSPLPTVVYLGPSMKHDIGYLAEPPPRCFA